MKTSALSAEKHGTIVPSNLNLGYMNAFHVLRVKRSKFDKKKIYYKVMELFFFAAQKFDSF